MRNRVGTRKEGLGRRVGMRRSAKRRAGVTAAQWRELEALWKAAVIRRAGGACERCGHTHALQCHHVFTRRIKSLFADLRNGVLLCKGCHFWWHNLAQGGDQWLWFVQKYGPERLESLRLSHAVLAKPDYDRIKAALVEGCD